LTKFLGGVGHGPGTNEFNFGDDPDHRRIQESEIRIHWIIEKVTNGFDEILWRAGGVARDQLIALS